MAQITEDEISVEIIDEETMRLHQNKESETVVGEIVNDMENQATPIDADETTAAGPAQPEIQQPHFPREISAELEAKTVDDETTKLLDIQN